jgi:hypothetical protein
MKKTLLALFFSIALLSGCSKANIDPQTNLFKQIQGNYEGYNIISNGITASLPQPVINSYAKAEIYKDADGRMKLYTKINIGTVSDIQETDITDLKEFDNYIYIQKQGLSEIKVKNKELIIAAVDGKNNVIVNFRRL